jgi:DHA3 family tetracycline resistance protein-like MFS transporter
MGLVLIFSSVPMLGLLLLGGVFVDRWPRLPIMIGSDGLRAIVVGLVAGLALNGQLAVWHLLVMSALFGATSAFFYPAYQALLPDVVAPADLPSANSLKSISLQLAGLMGPALAGLVVARGGSWLAFAGDSVSFVISACCLFAMPGKLTLRGSFTAQTGVFKDLRQGLATVARSPWLWITISIAGISNITLSGPFETVLPLLVARHTSNAAQMYGVLMTLSSAGSLLAAILFGRLKRLRWRGYGVYLPWLLAGLMLAAMGLWPAPGVMVLAACAWEACMTILGLAWYNSLQELVPSELLGRVASIDALGSYAFLPVGYALSGLAADHLGPAPVFLIGGLVSALIIALGLLHPAVRGLD